MSFLYHWTEEEKYTAWSNYVVQVGGTDEALPYPTWCDIWWKEDK